MLFLGGGMKNIGQTLRRSICIAVVVLFAGSDTLAQSPGSSIGYVKTVAGDASIVSGSKRTRAEAGRPLYEKDVLETGKDGALGATLKDNTLLSLGPNSRLALESYLLQPDRDAYSLITNITRGTVQYVSGLIAKLSPSSVKIKTPLATLGVRGTRLLVRVDAADD